jgi:hypothetical protein
VGKKNTEVENGKEIAVTGIVFGILDCVPGLYLFFFIAT